MPLLKYASFLRVIVIIQMFCLWLQIMTSTVGTDGDAYKVELDTRFIVTTTKEEVMIDNNTMEQMLALVPLELHKYLTGHPKNNNPNSTELPKNITEIRRAIQRYNEAQTILNEDIYGPVLNDTVIIAIQVHTRLTYLRHLIGSLAQARDIERTLLVFSHDYYDEEINSLVRTINFTKVVQIFYPYSIQTHPNEFPGVDPNDCPKDAKFEQAIKLKCNNALHPDNHGHYREATYTQSKHHWWWKANRIFNQLQCTSTHTGMVVFLEEDHYVAEDFLHVLSLMRTTADKSCPQCELLSLGTYLKTDEYYATTDKVEVTLWHSSIHNMGMVFNRTLWTTIVALQDQFCTYDDYNWDYSLLHLSQNRKGKERFKVMMCKVPRVFHIGECGTHHRKSNCDANLVVSKVQKLMQTTKHLLYPKRLTGSFYPGGVTHNKQPVKGNGGWGDIRDQELCTNMTRVGRQMKKYVYFP